MTRRLPPRLLALTPGDLGVAHVERFLGRAARACAAGLRGVLLREPSLSDRATLVLAEGLRARLGPAGYLVLHDRVHLFEAARADAVQLGFRSLAPRDARTLLPEHAVLGFSAHAGDATGVRDACDYLLLGPVFDTPSKRGLRAPLGIDGLARELARATRPVWALGGITAERAPEVLALGCAGVAARAAVFGDAAGESGVVGILAATRG